MAIKVTTEQLEAINAWKGMYEIYADAYKGLHAAKLAFREGTMDTDTYMAVVEGDKVLAQALEAAEAKALATCEGLDIYLFEDYTDADIEEEVAIQIELI